MKKIFKKENVMPVAVLAAICLVVALLLAAINLITAPEIERQKQAAVDAAFKDVLPDGSGFEKMTLSEDYPEEIAAAYKADGGYVFQLDVKGKEAMTIMVGVNDEGKVAGVKVITESETPGYKEKVLPLVTGENGKYNGMDSSTLKAEIVSGATLTSNGVYNAVKAALNGYAAATGGEVEDDPDDGGAGDTGDYRVRTYEEVVALAEAALGVKPGMLTDITPEGLDKVKYILRDNSRNNFIVYTLIINEQYHYVETETLIHITRDGVLQEIKKLHWQTSPEMNGYVPPTQEEADAYFDRLSGTTSDTFEEIDVVSQGTLTCGRLKEAVSEAFEAVNEFAWNDIGSTEDAIVTAASELLGVSKSELSEVTPKATTDVKRVYRHNKEGYAVYTVVYSPDYGTVETETVIHVGFDGKVKDIKRMIWKTSDTVVTDWYSFTAPDEQKVNTFYEGFLDKNLEGAENADIITGATATSGRFKASVVEAIKVVRAFGDKPSQAPRIIGIAVLSVAALAFIGYLVSPKVIEIIKRRKNG